MKKFKITMIKGLSRTSKTQRLTLTALGLRGRHSQVVLSDNLANRGQIMKVQHLISVEVVG